MFDTLFSSDFNCFCYFISLFWHQSNQNIHLTVDYITKFGNIFLWVGLSFSLVCINFLFFFFIMEDLASFLVQSQWFQKDIHKQIHFLPSKLSFDSFFLFPMEYFKYSSCWWIILTNQWSQKGEPGRWSKTSSFINLLIHVKIT